MKSLKALSIALAIVAVLVGLKSTTMAITDSPLNGVADEDLTGSTDADTNSGSDASASAPDAGTTDEGSNAGSDASAQDAGPTDTGASSEAEPDASAPTACTCPCTCPCTNTATTDAATAAEPPAAEPPAATSPPPPTALETAITKFVFVNKRVPNATIETLSCEELTQLHEAIWGRHGYNFPDAQKRADFAEHYDGLYVPLEHVNETTIGDYLTSKDKWTLMWIGRVAYHKGCHH